MEGLRRLVVEIHRRSLWQVLAVYLAGAWVAIQVVDHLTSAAGLPEWVPSFALVLLVLGLPVVLATALVQEGRPGRDGASSPGPLTTGLASREDGPGDPMREPAGTPPSTRDVGTTTPPSFLTRHLTWNRAMLGGAVAFGILALAVAGYFAMRAAGVGPVASLIAQGVIEEGEPIVLAEFRNATDDAVLGSVVTEALRVDLASSPALSVTERTRIGGALRRMGREADVLLTADLAREVALREGITAILEGEIGAAGSGFILSATLRSASEGTTLATFRRTARGEDDVIDAIDLLSQDIREKAGESLRAIRSGGSLQRVTTASLDALRRYTEAERLFTAGRDDEALPLLEEAVELDPDFAMAWRKIAVIHLNRGAAPERVEHAATEAYRLRERLTDRERYLAEAFYHSEVASDPDRATRAYERVLAIAPDDGTALNNLGLRHLEAGRFEEAEEVLARAADLPDPSTVAFENLFSVQTRRGRMEDARATVARHREAHPHDWRPLRTSFWLHAFALELDRAEEELAEIAAHPEGPGSGPTRPMFERVSAAMDILEGRVDAARARLRRAAEEAGPREGQLSLTIVGWIEGLVMQDMEAARATLARARRLAEPTDVPHHEGATTAMVELHLFTGDHAGARALLDEWERRLPPDSAPDGVRRDRELLRTWAVEGEERPEAVLDAHERGLRGGTSCAGCVEARLPLLLERAGRIDEALGVWQEFRTRSVSTPDYDLSMIPVVLRNIGRLAEETGDRQTALEAYSTLVGLWADADASLQPQVDALRARIAELEGAPPAGG